MIDTVTPGSMAEGMSWVGRVADEFTAPDRIEAGAVRHFCELVEDANPVYYDADAARVSVWRGPIAPPGSIQIWCMPLLWSPPGIPGAQPPRLQRNVPMPGNKLMALGVETEFILPLRVGDRLRYVESLDSITPKITRLGEGAIIGVSQRYCGEDGRLRARQRLSALRYTPLQSHAARASIDPQHDLAPSDFGFDLAVTLQRCVLSVSATRDYNPFHYDAEFARIGGAPGPFLNVMTYQGLFGRLLTDFAGPDSMISRLAFRMLNMNVPGDVAHVRGRISAQTMVEGRKQVMVDLWIYNERVGMTTQGSATLCWPLVTDVE